MLYAPRARDRSDAIAEDGGDQFAVLVDDPQAGVFAAQFGERGLDVDGSRFVIVRGGQNPPRAPSALASPQTLD
jgi:hypothetical protein